MISAFDFDRLQSHSADIVVTFIGPSVPNYLANCVKESITVTDECLLSAFFIFLGNLKFSLTFCEGNSKWNFNILES